MLGVSCALCWLVFVLVRYAVKLLLKLVVVSRLLVWYDSCELKCDSC